VPGTLPGPSPKEFDESFREVLNILQFALPDRQDRPTALFKGEFVSLVARDIDIKFGLPKVHMCFRNGGFRAVSVTMPEATMYENSLPLARED